MIRLLAIALFFTTAFVHSAIADESNVDMDELGCFDNDLEEFNKRLSFEFRKPSSTSVAAERLWELAPNLARASAIAIKPTVRELHYLANAALSEPLQAAILTEVFGRRLEEALANSCRPTSGDIDHRRIAARGYLNAVFVSYATQAGLRSEDESALAMEVASLGLPNVSDTSFVLLAFASLQRENRLDVAPFLLRWK